MYFLLLFTSAVAHADPIDDLAPGPAELGAVQTELESRLNSAEAIERAVARLQSTYLVTPATDELCQDLLRGPMIVRMRRFGDAWHDAAQRVRVQAKRVERIALAPTVTPVIDPDRRELLDKLLARAHAQEAAWLEFVAWTDHEGLQQCDLTLAAMSGLPDPIIRAEGETAGLVAVSSVGTGFACPGGVPVSDKVLILNGPVCWSESATCACDPVPVDPAAILGPK